MSHFALTRRRLWIAAVLLLLVALGAIAVRYWAPGRTPTGQPPLADLTIPAFQQAFNDAAGGVRVILLLSPT